MPFVSPNFQEAITLYGQRLPNALGTTLSVTIGAVLIGLIVGLLLAVVQTSSVKALGGVAKAIVAVVRCTPAPPFLYLVYFTVLALLFRVSAAQAGTLALGILLAPYMAELFRSGIQSVPKGQIEAGLALGMSPALVNRRIVLPQAIKIMLPAIGAMAVGTLLNSAVVAILGGKDMTGMARNIINAYFTTELYFVLAATYFLIAYPASRVLAMLERRSKLNL